MCAFLYLQIVNGSMSACEEGDDYARKVMSMMNHGIIMKRVMIILGRNKTQDNMVDARQAIHPCISNAPMFLLLALFSKVLLYMCYMLVASPMV